MPIRLQHSIKLTDEMLTWLGASLDVYLFHNEEPDTELEVYRQCLAHQLEHRVTRKSHAMSHALQRECRFRFSVAEIVLVRTILMEQPYDRRSQNLLRRFDQARVNLLPLHPT